MKKTVMFIMTAVMVFSLSGCGGKEENQGGKESLYADGLAVLNQVVKAYSEDELFAMYGGDQENAVMDAPGKFDISKTEELENVLGIPADQISNIEDAASMVHMMNANTFTGGVYRLKEGADMDAFADSAADCILAKQWICGQPDTLVIINVDGRYVIVAYGEAEIMEIFKNNALKALDGAQVMTEAPVA
ncbi:hypothetical protein D7V94_17370 [Parablautia intestinalis]|uniref:Bacteriocin transport accessory protein n=2 Tax=Parablautia intestinalis TaxID=2320100 RepID=A0A3A9ADR1_9FIRM|nr:hypothetical protein [Lachnospiraceae bacterium]RKI89599.1 hypothetical protein D7V94_17370 [Parablautia intestinalis]